MAWPSMDPYGFRARTLPMFIVLVPVATVIAAWTPGVLSIATGLGGAVVLGGASYFLGQIARNVGKRRERSLWRSWGGSPAVQLLRHRDGGLHHRRKQKCHDVLRGLGESVPTAKQEESDPREADGRYEACVKALIGRTGDRTRFTLLFEENVNYGFWRNLWALKLLGVICALIAMVLCVVRAWPWGATPYEEAALVGGAIDIALLLVWWSAVSPDAVRIPAKAYAERLLEACEQLGQDKKS
jgi:hypothetical protein